MKLTRVPSNEIIDAKIEKLNEKGLDQLKNSDRFLFDWIKEMNNEIFTIKAVDNEKILGLISLIDVPEELRIHIQLIEAAIENTGENKKIKNIPGCLIAFACESAFKKGYDGFVSLVPKTKLIDHYQDCYGFRQFGKMLAVEGSFSNNLILKYLYNEL